MKQTIFVLTAGLGLGQLVSIPMRAASICTLSNATFSIEREPNKKPLNDYRCSYQGGTFCHLDGWLYSPKVPLDRPFPTFPVVVFNHGSGKENDEIFAIAEYLTKQGIAVFAPLRRGHEHNADAHGAIRNSGLHTDDYLAGLPICQRDREEVQYLNSQVAELKDALRFLALPQSGLRTDPARMTIMGHSFGGSLVLFAASESMSPKPKAVVDISGAVLEWDRNKWWHDPLSESVGSRRMPIFFFQPSNESSHNPTFVLSKDAGTTGDEMFQSAFFRQASALFRTILQATAGQAASS